MAATRHCTFGDILCSKSHFRYTLSQPSYSSIQCCAATVWWGNSWHHVSFTFTCRYDLLASSAVLSGLHTDISSLCKYMHTHRDTVQNC